MHLHQRNGRGFSLLVQFAVVDAGGFEQRREGAVVRATLPADGAERVGPVELDQLGLAVRIEAPGAAEHGRVRAEVEAGCWSRRRVFRGRRAHGDGSGRCGVDGRCARNGRCRCASAEAVVAGEPAGIRNLATVSSRLQSVRRHNRSQTSAGMMALCGSAKVYDARLMLKMSKWSLTTHACQSVHTGRLGKHRGYPQRILRDTTSPLATDPDHAQRKQCKGSGQRHRSDHLKGRRRSALIFVDHQIPARGSEGSRRLQAKPVE